MHVQNKPTRTPAFLLGIPLFLVCVLGYAFFLRGECGNRLFPVLVILECLQCLQCLPFLALGVIGTSTFAFGFTASCSVLRSVGFLFFTPRKPAFPENLIAVLRFMIVSAYALGGLLFLISLHNIVASVQGNFLGKSIMLSISTLMSPILISEAVLRPLKTRIENLGGKKIDP